MYLLTVIGLTLCGSSTEHIYSRAVVQYTFTVVQYTFTIVQYTFTHKQYTEQHIENNIQNRTYLTIRIYRRTNKNT